MTSPLVVGAGSPLAAVNLTQQQFVAPAFAWHPTPETDPVWNPARYMPFAGSADPYTVVQDWNVANSGTGTPASQAVTLLNAVNATANNTLLVAVNSDATVSTPAGYTLIASSIHNAGCYLFAKIADGSETGVTVSPTVSASTMVAIKEIHGLPFGTIATQIDKTATNGSAIGTTTWSTGTTTTTTQADEYVVAIWGYSSAQANYPNGGGNKWSGETNSFVEVFDAGTTKATGTNVGLCIAEKILSATGTAESTATTFSGISVPAETIIATLKINAPISSQSIAGTITSTTTTTGVLTQAMAISGSVTCTTTTTGALTGTLVISGSITCTTTTTGDVTIPGSTQAISGAITCVTTTSGAITGILTITGTASVVTTTSGSIVATLIIAGSTTCTTITTGSFGTLPIAGSVTCTTTTAGSVTLTAVIAGSTSSTTTTTGSIVRIGQLAGVIVSATVTTGQLIWLARITGAISSVTTTVGDIGFSPVPPPLRPANVAVPVVRKTATSSTQRDTVASSLSRRTA